MKNRKSLISNATPNLLYNPITHILLIAIFTLIVYSNTFHAPFQFDDSREILENPTVKNLEYFINLSTHGTRYVGYLTFALNYALHGLDVVGYHIFNLAIHLVNALLVYWLIILSFRTPTLKESTLKESSKLIALFAALFFACHPVQTQAVTYIVQRLASLATLFYLFSIVSYSKARVISQEVRSKAKSLPWYGVSLFSAVLAMKTKEISFTLPVVIILYEFMFFNGKIKRRILYFLPLFLTLLIIPLSLIGIDKPLGDLIGDVSEVARVLTNISRGVYFFTEFRVIVTYIRLIFLPANQNLDYDYPIYHSFFDPRVFLSFLFLLLILTLGIYLFYRYRKIAPHTRLISFGIFWFFITLSVESSIIPIVDVIFEHRIYLPSVGFFIALVTFIFWVRNRLKSSMPVAGRAVIPMLVVITIILSTVTYARNNIWQDEAKLWEDAVKKSPAKIRPHMNLGVAYSNKGRLDKAIEQFKIVLLRYPNNAEAHDNLGIVFSKKGLMDKAIEEFQTSIKLRPNFYDTYYNMGLAFFKKGWPEKAIEQYKASLIIRPNFAEAYVNLGIAYGVVGSIDKAVEYLQTAVKLKPYLAEAHNNLGTAYEKSGSMDKAIEHLRIAVKLQPDLAEAHHNLGKAYIASGSMDKAIEHLRIAVKLQPDLAEAHHNLGKALVGTGLTDRAIEHYQIAIKINPDYAEAYSDLGSAFFRKGLIEKAIQHYQIALRLNQDITEAHYNLGVCFLDKGQIDKAIKEYQIAIRINPQFPDAHENLGIAYANKGLIDKAIEHFQIALRLNPQNPVFRSNLARAYELKISGKKDKVE